jgi:hypothetical protein
MVVRLKLRVYLRRMLHFILAAAGAVIGALTARRRKGNGFDIAQYAAVYALIGFVFGILLTIVVTRMA